MLQVNVEVSLIYLYRNLKSMPTYKMWIKAVVIQQMLYFRFIMGLHHPALLCLAAALASTCVVSYPWVWHLYEYIFGRILSLMKGCINTGLYRLCVVLADTCGPNWSWHITGLLPSVAWVPFFFLLTSSRIECSALQHQPLAILCFVWQQTRDDICLIT